jgi:hypothetical protein
MAEPFSIETNQLRNRKPKLSRFSINNCAAAVRGKEKKIGSHN